MGVGLRATAETRQQPSGLSNIGLLALLTLSVWVSGTDNLEGLTVIVFHPLNEKKTNKKKQKMRFVRFYLLRNKNETFVLSSTTYLGR